MNNFTIPISWGMTPGGTYQIHVESIPENEWEGITLTAETSIRIKGQDEMPDFSVARRNTEQEPDTNAILTLADGLYDQEEFFAALSRLPRQWSKPYEDLIDLIETYGYKFKSFEDFSPEDIGEKIVYLRHDVHQYDIASLYPLLAVAYTRNIPVIASLGWENNPLTPYYTRDFHNIMKFTDNRLVRLTLHTNPVASAIILKFNNRVSIKQEEFVEILSDWRECKKNSIGSFEDLIVASEQFLLRQTIKFNNFFGRAKTITTHGDYTLNRAIARWRDTLKGNQLSENDCGITVTDIDNFVLINSFLGDYKRRARYGFTYESTVIADDYPKKAAYIGDVFNDVKKNIFIEWLEAGKTISLLIHPRVVERLMPVQDNVKPRQLEDIALSAKVTAASPTHPGFNVENALDGNANNNYAAMMKGMPPQGFILNLGRKALVHEIRLVFESGDNFPVDFRLDAVEPSDEIENASVVSPVVRIKGHTGKVWQKRFLSPVEIDNLRFLSDAFHGQNRLLMRQISIFAEPDPSKTETVEP